MICDDEKLARKEATRFLRYISLHFAKEVVCGGMLPASNKSEKNFYSCWAFYSTSERFNVAQIVVPLVDNGDLRYHTDEYKLAQQKELTKKLNLVNDHIIRSNKTNLCVLNFRCVGRDRDIFNTTSEMDFELSEFKKLFPKVPFCGLLSSGEIGNDCLPSLQGDTKANDQDLVIRAFASVFTFISIN